MKKTALLFALMTVSLACNSKPLENSNRSIVGAFSSLEKGRIGFELIEVVGDKCVEIKKGKEADCEVQSVKLKLGFNTNFNQENGVIKSIVSGVIPNESTVKKGETVILTGKFKLKAGSIGSGVQFNSWNLRNLELRRI